jgi:hypothetical protein
MDELKQNPKDEHETKSRTPKRKIEMGTAG